MKRILSIFLSLVLLLAVTFTSGAAATYTDISDHWAKTAIEKWSDLGIIEGYENQFRPDDSITRGEFAVILNRILKYQSSSTNTYSDLSAAFYTDAILKATHYGVIKGYDDGTVAPAKNISRQEAMVMITRAFKILPVTNYTMKATDADQIADYAKASAASLEAKGYMQGREDGKICPLDTITRAEVITIFNRLIGKIFASAGTYTENITGNVVVNTAGTTLKDMTITGSLMIAPGVAEGDVVLDNVTITGRLIVLGGGVNSVKIINATKISGNIHIDKIDGEVRVYTDDGTVIPAVIIEDGSNDVILDGTFGSVTVNADVEITIPAGSSVNELIANAPVSVSGDGTITSAVLTQDATGSTFANEPAGVTAPSGVEVTIGTTPYVSDGTTLVEQTSDAGGSSGGGSGGGGGGSSAVMVSGVTLYMSNAPAGVNASTVTGGYAFDLSDLAAYPDTAYITGIKITTSSATTFATGGYTINTNTVVPMSTFLNMLGLDTTATVTMGKIRDIGSSFSVNGTVTGGSALGITFTVGGLGFYDLTNTGTVVTAKLINDTDVAGIDAMLGYDPMQLLIANLTDTGSSTLYMMTVTNGIITVTKPYVGYASVSALSLSGLVALVNGNGGTTISKLSDLTGYSITLTYGIKTLTLNMTM